MAKNNGTPQGTLIIEDVSPADMQAARRTRSRSPEVQLLVDAVADLKPGAAKAVTLPEGLPPAKARTKLVRAAEICGVKLRTTVGDDGRLFFALRAEKGSRTRSRTA